MGSQILLSAVLFFFLSNFVVGSEDTEEELYREKRQINGLPLVYPYGGSFKFIIGMSLPIKNDDKVALVFQANIQFQYVQFANISELSRYYFIKEVSREEREADLRVRRNERLVFYRSVEELLTIKGFHGQDCIMRAICEAAQFTMEEEGMVGELLHVLLTPDYGKSVFEDEDPDLQEAMSSYKDAAVAGRQMFDCPSIYSKCPEGQGILEMISILRDE